MRRTETAPQRRNETRLLRSVFFTALPRPRTHVHCAPMPTYLITFRTQGTWLHGDPRGSVDPRHNRPGAPFVAPNPRLMQRDRTRMTSAPVILDDAQRTIVDDVIRGVCAHQRWTLHALHVRTNHVHAIVTAPDRPERIMHAFKARSTRRLVEAGLVTQGTRTWARHGSTRWLNTDATFDAACRYVMEEQGNQTSGAASDAARRYDARRPRAGLREVVVAGARGGAGTVARRSAAAPSPRGRRSTTIATAQQQMLRPPLDTH